MNEAQCAMILELATIIINNYNLAALGTGGNKINQFINVCLPCIAVLTY